MHARTILGEVLRDLREEARLTQKQLAAKVDASDTHLCRIERGRVREPGRDLLIRIAESCGRTYSYVEAEVERRKKQREDRAYPSFTEEERRRAAEVREKGQRLDVFLDLPGDEDKKRR